MSSLVKARQSNFGTYDSAGRQAVSVDSINPDGHGLATEAKQDTQINATNRDINNTTSIGDGSSQATALCLGYDRSGGKGRSLAVDSDGNLQCDIVSGTVGVGDVRIKGNDGNDGAGTDRIMKTDANGVVQVGGTVTTSISDVVIKGNDGNDGSGTDRTIKTDGNGAVIVDPSKEGVVSADGTTTALHSMMLGNNSGNLRTIKCDANGVVSVDGSASTQPVSGVGTFAVSAASLPLPSGAATEATLSNAEGHLGTIDTSTAGIFGSHYQEGDAIGASDTGVLIMGRNGTNAAKPIHITNNGDVEVEIADFVKGQATKANSFPVVLASDTDTLPVEQSYSYSSELTLFSAVTINDGNNSTSAAFEIQSVKVQDPIITFTVDSGGSTNYEVLAIGSHDGTNFFDIGFAKSFSQSEMSSTSDMGLKVPRYMKFKISNNHGSSSHIFTLKAAVLGATLA